MVEIELTKMSSKGQIVIPSDMRVDFKEGEQFIIIKNDTQLILKPIKDFNKSLEEDIKFAKKTDEALKRYEKGLFKTMNGEDFLKSLDKW